ncbi:MAG: acyl--CoA ligase, partial [Ruminiclostridium sp.]|nr:acyl--CoA ligase [Ruminiclostridium sp.]
MADVTMYPKQLPSVEKPWMKFYSNEAKQAVLPKQTIYTYMAEANADNRNSIALNYFDRKITYGELLDLIDACAAAFVKEGIKKGDIVAVCSATTPEMVIVLYALNKIGAAMYTLDPRRSPAEIREYVQTSSAKIFMLLDVAYDRFAGVLPDLNVEKVVITSLSTFVPFVVRTLMRFKMPPPRIAYAENVITWNEFMSAGVGIYPDPVAYEENALVAVVLTGGTTGTPKGVMLSNDGFNSVALALSYAMECGTAETLDTRHPFLNVIPIFTSYGIVGSLHAPLSRGLEVILIPKVEPDKMGHYIKKYKPGYTMLVPAFYEKLLASKEMRGNFDLSFISAAGSGGDTMTVGLETKINDFLAEHGCRYPLSQGYGMSEVSSAVSANVGMNFKSLSVGYPLLATDIGIFNPGTTEELGYGEEGEVCIAGPSIMLGYFKNPEETEKVMIPHEDGRIWVHSGDLGVLDEDGFLFIKGRIKRMITRFDGHKVFPVQMEGLLSGVDNVRSCAVVGVKDPDHDMGQLPLAVISLEDTSLAAQAKAEITQLVLDSVEERGRPCDILFVDEMP